MHLRRFLLQAVVVLLVGSVTQASLLGEDFQNADDPTLAGFDPVFNHRIGSDEFGRSSSVFSQFKTSRFVSPSHSLFLAPATDYITFNLLPGQYVDYAEVWMASGQNNPRAIFHVIGTQGELFEEVGVPPTLPLARRDTWGANLGQIVEIRLTGYEGYFDDLWISVVPEPSTLWLLLAGCLLAVLVRRPARASVEPAALLAGGGWSLQRECQIRSAVPHAGAALPRSTKSGQAHIRRPMMRFQRVLLQAAVLCLMESAAQATLLTFHFEGKVTQISDSANVLGGSVLVDDAFKGSYTFNSTTPDLNPDSEAGSYATIGPYLLTIGTLSLASTGTGHVSIHDRIHGWGLDAYGAGSGPFLSDGFHVSELWFDLVDPTASALSSDMLLLAPPVLANYSTRRFWFEGHGDRVADTFLVLGEITAIPEPTTLWLFGVAGLAAIRRRRGAAILGGLVPLFSFFAVAGELSGDELLLSGGQVQQQSDCVPISGETVDIVFVLDGDRNGDAARIITRRVPVSIPQANFRPTTKGPNPMDRRRSDLEYCSQGASGRAHGCA